MVERKPIIPPRLPDDFEECDEEDIMSNFDHIVIKKTEKAIKGKKMYSCYPGWNFHGKVWWDKSRHCQVMGYGVYRGTISAKTTEELMEKVSQEFGYD